MLPANKINLLILIISIISLARGEILYFLTAGKEYLWWHNATLKLPGKNLPGTTISLYGHMQGKGDHINLLDRNNNILFQHVLPMPANTHWSVIFVTEVGGMRLFTFGEETGFIKVNVEEADAVFLGNTAWQSMTVARNEPLWAMTGLEQQDRNIYDFGTKGLELKNPKQFDLTNMETSKVTVGSYIVITGEVDWRNSNEIYIYASEGASKRWPFHITFRGQPSESKDFFEISYSDAETGAFRLDERVRRTHEPVYSRFTLALVCEWLGWRVYINGDEFHFFHHRAYTTFIDKLTVASKQGGPNWKLMKLIYKYNDLYINTSSIVTNLQPLKTY